MAAGDRVALGCREHGVGAGVVDDLAGSDGGHSQAPLVFRWTAWIAVSAVTKRTSRSRPPKQKFTAPGSSISPSRSPAGANTCTPLNDDAYTRPSRSVLTPSGKP